MMKRFLLLVMCLAAAVTSMSAQTVDATVCDILANPQSFDGKTVRIKGTVIAGFDEFAVKDSTCKQPVNAIWLAYPEGTKGKAGPVGFVQLQLAKNSAGTPAALNRTPTRLDKNKDFKQFDSLLSTQYKGRGMCLGCVRYTVTATLVGRLDGTKMTGVSRDIGGKFVAAAGFGNMNQYSARLVLQSVSDVIPQEIDYSKTAGIKEGGQADSGGDPVAAARQLVKAFEPGSPAAVQVQEAAAAYGKEGEDNGVVLGFGVANEVAANDGAKGEGTSPDGLLLNCKFDMDRLKGDALSKAILHMGTHIADVRADRSGQKPVDAEYRAWQTTMMGALASGQKSLTLPGGHLVWSSAWPTPDRVKMMNDALSAFLRSWTPFAN